MPDYSKGKIYTIRCKNDPSLIYVGSTIQPLSKRWGEHKTTSLRHPNYLIYSTINNDWDNWYIELYEEYPCENKEQLCKKEGEIIRLMGNLNIKIAGRNQKEYQLDNKEKIKEYKKEYQLKNAEKLKEIYQEYYKDNKEKILEKQKEYNNDNKNKIKEYQKQYQLENADIKKIYDKEYKIENQDRIKERDKQYYFNNKDKNKEKQKQYRLKNAEKIKELNKQYRLKKKLKNQENISVENSLYYIDNDRNNKLV